MASSFLNKSGLSYFWAKIKAYVDGKFLVKPSGGTPGQVLTKTSAGGENWEDPAKAPIQVPVTLSASAWSSNQQTISVSGVLADETKQLIQIVPAIASQTAYFDAGIRCVNQGADSLTFECQETPTENVSAFAVITSLRASS